VDGRVKPGHDAESSAASALRLADLLDLLLERVDALLELGHRRVLVLLGRLLARAGAADEGRREHLHRLLEDGEVLLAHLLDLAEREHAAERVVERLAHLLLVAAERRHHVLEIARHEPLHAVAVKPDELAQEAGRQQILPDLLLLLDDDLRQHRPRDVLAGLGVVDDELAAALHHRAEVVERDVAARRRVVEPPVGVFLDDDRRRFAAAWCAGGATRMGRIRCHKIEHTGAHPAPQ